MGLVLSSCSETSWHCHKNKLGEPSGDIYVVQSLPLPQPAASTNHCTYERCHLDQPAPSNLPAAYRNMSESRHAQQKNWLAGWTQPKLPTNRTHDLINDYSFKPPSFGLACYTAKTNWYWGHHRTYFMRTPMNRPVTIEGKREAALRMSGSSNYSQKWIYIWNAELLH